MTRKEARELFEDNFTVINTHGHYTKEEEGQAQELAISALSEDVRIHARWEDGHCSNCHVFIPDDLKTILRDYCDNDFCPNCGADMRPEPYKGE